MDIYCVKCGEPIEIETIHEYASDTGSTFTEVLQVFQSAGCGEAFSNWGFTCNPSIEGNDRASIAAIAYELLGDDIDGAAAMFDEWDFLTQ